jgi:hypothetical protein
MHGRLISIHRAFADFKIDEICIDVDGVLRNLVDPFLYYGTGVSQMTTYNNKAFSEYWNRMIKSPDTASGMYLGADPYPGALEAVLKLKASFPDKQITFLTAAFHPEFPYLNELTRQWLEKQGMRAAADGLVFASAKEKVAYMKYRPAVLFDDNAATINEINPPSFGVWIYGCYEDDTLEQTPNRSSAYTLKDAVDIICNPAFKTSASSDGGGSTL